MSQQQLVGDLTNGLRGLSHEQLVQIIMNIVHMQEDGLQCENTSLRSLLLEKMPIADIELLIQQLRVLRQNIYASLVCSNLDDSAYSRAYVHLDIFEVSKYFFFRFKVQERKLNHPYLSIWALHRIQSLCLLKVNSSFLM